ncbi:hypothetical protein U1Q18_052144 [Sarracenia purpurea var. burkii]
MGDGCSKAYMIVPASCQKVSYSIHPLLLRQRQDIRTLICKLKRSSWMSISELNRYGNGGRLIAMISAMRKQRLNIYKITVISNSRPNRPGTGLLYREKVPGSATAFDDAALSASA